MSEGIAVHSSAARTARRYLGARAADLCEAEREALLAEVMGVLEHPGFAPVFAPGSRAEAPVAGRISIGGEIVPVSGQVDRLAVTPGAVFIVDFKTDREPPSEPEDVPTAYVAQLAAYRAVLAALYPERAVRAALLWTAAPSIMPLPARLLDRALRG